MTRSRAAADMGKNQKNANQRNLDDGMSMTALEKAVRTTSSETTAGQERIPPEVQRKLDAL